MPCTEDFIEYVCRQLDGTGVIRTRKMFGDWCIYVDEKPTLLVCDNTAYIKKHSVISHLMRNAECGFPFDGAREHYILNLDHADEVKEVVSTLLPFLDYPKKKIRKKKQERHQDD